MLFVVIYVLQNLKKQKSKYKEECSKTEMKNSFYEVYLCQAAVFNVVRIITSNDLSYYLLSMVGCILVGYTMHLFNIYISKLLIK